MKVVVSGTRRYDFVAEIDLPVESLHDAADTVMGMSIHDIGKYVTYMDDFREGYMTVEVVQEDGNPDHFIIVDEDGDFIEEGRPRED